MALFFQRAQNPEPVSPPFVCNETPEAFFVAGERADPQGRDLARFVRGAPFVVTCGVLAPGGALLDGLDGEPNGGRFYVHNAQSCAEGHEAARA